MARRMRRRTEWLAAVVADTTLGSGANLLVTLKTSAELRDVAGAEPTIVRIRGTLFGGLDFAPDTITRSARLLAAIRCVHDGLTTAPALNTAAVAEEDDWMWYAARRLDAPFQRREYWNGSTAVAYNRSWRGQPAFFSWDVDVKAMRKAPDPCALQLCLSNIDITGSSDIQFGGLLRILVKQTP